MWPSMYSWSYFSLSPLFLSVLNGVRTIVIKVLCGTSGFFHCEGFQVTGRTVSISSWKSIESVDCADHSTAKMFYDHPSQDPVFEGCQETTSSTTCKGLFGGGVHALQPSTSVIAPHLVRNF